MINVLAVIGCLCLLVWFFWLASRPPDIDWDPVDETQGVHHLPTDGGPTLAPAGYVYLLKMYGVTKVGITRDPERRLKEHRNNGWRQVRVWKVSDIEEARRIESSCLHTARSIGALVSEEELKAIMPQGGYTEVTRLTPEHLEQLINQQIH